MVDMDKFRVQEQQNGSIVLNPGDTQLHNTDSDGHFVRPEERDHLEVIVQELNERFHFDFEDRDKVVSIVLPKLVNDEGLKAAFETDNIEDLRRQKFADSMEDAFYGSANDFLDILNRMSEEPDFKRAMMEFLLEEFRRRIEGEGGTDG